MWTIKNRTSYDWSNIHISFKFKDTYTGTGGDTFNKKVSVGETIVIHSKDLSNQYRSPEVKIIEMTRLVVETTDGGVFYVDCSGKHVLIYNEMSEKVNGKLIGTFKSINKMGY